MAPWVDVIPVGVSPGWTFAVFFFFFFESERLHRSIGCHVKPFEGVRIVFCLLCK